MGVLFLFSYPAHNHNLFRVHSHAEFFSPGTNQKGNTRQRSVAVILESYTKDRTVCENGKGSQMMAMFERCVQVLSEILQQDTVSLFTTTFEL